MYSLNLKTSIVDRAMQNIDDIVHHKKSCPQLTLLNAQHAERANAEDFVREVFFNAYRAKLDSFYPLLLSIRSSNNNSHCKYTAVAGIRPASEAPLFLEHYFDQPIENILSVERHRIIEIGNLAPANAGQARWLITTLNAFLVGAGFTHVVFTAVPKLKNAFSRMGLPLIELTEADGNVLSTKERANWGSYYELKPKVFVGDLRMGEAPLTAIEKKHFLMNELCEQARKIGKDYIANLVSQQ